VLLILSLVTQIAIEMQKQLKVGAATSIYTRCHAYLLCWAFL